MKKLGFLHITDLHTGGDTEPVGDVKDVSVSPYLRRELSQTTQEVFFRTAQSLLHGFSLDAILCTGDLGQGRERGSTTAGAKFLARLADRLGVPATKVIVVPGNHDVDRTASKGRELAEFSSACEAQGFVFPSGATPVCMKVGSVPILGLNSCIGGGEKALHGMPEDFWDSVRCWMAKTEEDSLLAGRTDVPEAFKHALQAMDIPAVGVSQMGLALDLLEHAQGNCLIVLAHHAPLPTPNVEVRPYAFLVDSGPVLHQLMNGGRRVLFFHGHSHCHSTLLASPPDSEPHAFAVSLGARGLHGPYAEVFYVCLLVGDLGDFLMASVTRFEMQGSVFRQQKVCVVEDPKPSSTRSGIDFARLPPDTIYPFSSVAERLGVPATLENG